MGIGWNWVEFFKFTNKLFFHDFLQWLFGPLHISLPYAVDEAFSLQVRSNNLQGCKF